jgi:hypothetical protein
MLRKNKTALIVLFILLCIAGWYYFSTGDQTFNKKESEFALVDTLGVSQVQIINKDQKLVLQKTDEYWKFDYRLHASPAMIRILFRFISQVEIKSVVEKSIRTSVINNLMENGAEVKIYAGQKILKDYFIIADTATHNIYMLMSGFKHPFIVTLPAFEGNFAGLFNMYVDLWRDRSLFRLKPTNIELIKAEYFSDPSQSFELQLNKNKVLIKSLQSLKAIDFKTEAVEAYLYCFRNLRIEKYVNRNDSLAKLFISRQPEKEITITDKRNNHYCLKIFSIPEKNGKFDVNQCFAFINDSDAALIKYVEIDPITRSLSFFKK